MTLTAWRAILCAALVLAGAARPCPGHPESLSMLTVMVEAERVRLMLVVPAHDLPALYPPAPGQTDADYAPAAARQLEADAPEAIELRLNYAPVGPSGARARAEGEDRVVLEAEYAVADATPEPVKALQVYWHRLAKLPEGHRTLLFVHDGRGESTFPLPIDGGRVVARHTLTPGQCSAFVELPLLPSTSPTNRPTTRPAAAPPEPRADVPAPAPPVSFFALGVGHILAGYDHLLFLAALLLVCRTFAEAAKIITCFTVAHSITLALAALDVVRLPARLVEPVIAASIVYVAAENLWQHLRREGRHPVGRRMAVTFGFGLVHGLGFASVLRESGLGAGGGRGVVWPLLQFNLGVEAGQVAVAAVVFPLLLAARRRPAFERRWVPAASALVALTGMWWLVERAAFS